MMYSGLGLNLRAERELRGITLSELSSATKIPHRHLELLESDRFDLLPDDFFVRGYLKAYCDVLGLDHEKVFLDYRFLKEMYFNRDKPDEEESNSGSRSKKAIPVIGFILITVVILLWATRSEPASAGKRIVHQDQSAHDITSNLSETGLESLKKWSDQQISFPASMLEMETLKEVPVHRSVSVRALKDVWIHTRSMHDGREQLMVIFKGETRILKVGGGFVIRFSEPASVDICLDGDPNEKVLLDSDQVRFVPWSEKRIIESEESIKGGGRWRKPDL